MATVVTSDKNLKIKIKDKVSKKKEKTQALAKKNKKNGKKKKKKTTTTPPSSGGGKGDGVWAGATSCASNGNVWMGLNVFCCPCVSMGQIWQAYHQPGGFCVGCCCQCPCCWLMLREKMAAVHGIDDKVMSVVCPCFCPCLNCTQVIMTAYHYNYFDGFAFGHHSGEPGSPKMSRTPAGSPEKRNNQKEGGAAADNQKEGVAAGVSKEKKGKADKKTKKVDKKEKEGGINEGVDDLFGDE